MLDEPEQDLKIDYTKVKPNRFIIYRAITHLRYWERRHEKPGSVLSDLRRAKELIERAMAQIERENGV